MEHEDRQGYQAPAIIEIAGLHELTLDHDKNYHPKSDGYTFQHHKINCS